MEIKNKITIIEGPTPTFETSIGQWILSLNEGPSLGSIALTRLRTFNGASLVERCYHAWQQKEPILLEFRTTEGHAHTVPIIAARNVRLPEGDSLLLWVRFSSEDPMVEIEFDSDIFDEDWFDDDEDEDLDDFDFDLDLPDDPLL